jgi:uncharacterized protein (DUF885 family)
MRLTPLALAVCLAFAAGGCNNDSKAPEAAAPKAMTAEDAAAKVKQLDAMYAEYWEENLKLNPITATFMGDPRYNDQLPNFLSAESRAKQEEFDKRWLAKAQAIGPDGLEGQARLSYDIFVRDRTLSLESTQFPGWMQPIEQFNNLAGFAAQLGSGTMAQPFATVKDYDNWLARGKVLPAILDQAVANMREGMAKGVVQPRPLMEKVIPQLDALINADPEKTLFWGPVGKMPESFSAADKARITAAYRAMIADGLMPAYVRLRDFIRDEYLPKTRDTVSLSALPDGKAWYAFNVKTQTTTDLTPAAIHDIGLAEVARIHGEMRKVMEQVGFKGTLQEFFKFVSSDKQFQFKDEADLLAQYNSLRTRVDAKIPELFSLTPKAPFEIRPIEPFRAESAAGGQYFPPSQDGSRPGIFYVNTFNLPTRMNWEMESLYLHEAVPGHHFQIALQQELPELPAFRRFGGETAFAEGWGLYAESLGKDLGIYTDPYQYFGRLQNELWRAIRLVVDTGLHDKGWTRDQVIKYMLENSAASEGESTAEAERYIAIPGQALAYKIGELKILELRDRARAALGDKYDPREFHAEVLRDGSVPLSVLEAKIDRWIASKKG